ncbi:hypothetical protein [Streptomyces sp. Isolate_45]|uniref:hypothetical protein n=1 Tax=Streptomyces sp. Isolate_45 TaxID=2950111 RepID=UPI002481CAD0|nr:hypothetical protein [Streptomyces sp. Isolate_45]MDA5279914.1 hypothetical protein [Streptomyces sp. Isolate_45]
MRKPLMVLAAAGMTAIAFATPAQATVNTVDMPFGMAYGNSTTSGTIHFTDGYSASVSGTVHRASGLRQVCAHGVNGNWRTEDKCSPYATAGEPDQTIRGTMTLDVPGGVQRVYITMYDGNNVELAKEFCTRIGCTRVI